MRKGTVVRPSCHVYVPKRSVNPTKCRWKVVCTAKANVLVLLSSLIVTLSRLVGAGHVPFPSPVKAIKSEVEEFQVVYAM